MGKQKQKARINPGCLVKLRVDLLLMQVAMIQTTIEEDCGPPLTNDQWSRASSPFLTLEDSLNLNLFPESPNITDLEDLFVLKDDNIEQLDAHVDTNALGDSTSTGMISTVAERLDDSTVSILIKEGLRHKINARSPTFPTSSTEEKTFTAYQPTEEEIERRKRRRELNREWARKDRERRKHDEEILEKKIRRLESNNLELEKEIAVLKQEVVDLRACWHMHSVCYH